MQEAMCALVKGTCWVDVLHKTQHEGAATRQGQAGACMSHG
jgi:hypothetical protein